MPSNWNHKFSQVTAPKSSIPLGIEAMEGNFLVCCRQQPGKEGMGGWVRRRYLSLSETAVQLMETWKWNGMQDNEMQDNEMQDASEHTFWILALYETALCKWFIHLSKKYWGLVAWSTLHTVPCGLLSTGHGILTGCWQSVCSCGWVVRSIMEDETSGN